MIFAGIRALVGRLLPSAAAEVPSTLPSPLLAAAQVEALEFVEGGTPPEFERFGLLALSLDSAIERDREGLAAIEAVEACPRGNGRRHGLEWAYEQLFLDADRLRQVRDLLRLLADREPEVRAIMARSVQ